MWLAGHSNPVTIGSRDLDLLSEITQNVLFLGGGRGGGLVIYLPHAKLSLYR